MQKTKKNWVLRVMLLALVFTLASTCLLSGTLAKYVTSVSGTDTARVAKWLTGTNFTVDLFDGSDPNVLITSGGINTGADNKKLIAPGTTGSYSFQLEDNFSSTPEVSYAFTVDATGTYNGNWNGYYPVLFTLKNTTTSTTLAGPVSLDALVAALEANVTLERKLNVAATSQEYEISWEWPFYTSDAADAKDTALGQAAITGDLTVELALSIIATQID